MKSALLVIDMQNALLKAKPYRGDLLLEIVSALLEKAREKQFPIIFVQHTDDELIRQSEDWQIIPQVSPLPTEAVFEKFYSSSFKNTKLKNYLNQHGINQLIIVGMQTEYCIESTVRVGFELGFEIILPESGNSTLDRGNWTAKQLYEHHLFDIMENRFARVLSLDETLKLIV